MQTLQVELDPSLKDKQVEAMSNGDIFLPSPPPFEIYPTEISHGRDKEKVESYVFGIKCATHHARLLKEFFTQFSNPMEMDARFGVFLPTGAAHLIGVEAYKKLLCDNNEYQQSVTTVPLGDFPHETLHLPFPCEQNTDIDLTNLYEIILEQLWCLSVEKTTTPNKILIVTTKAQVLAAREWADTKLLDLYQQHITDELDVTMISQLTPRQLDKPHVTAAATRYADQLKQRSAYIQSTTTTTPQFTRPIKTRHIKPTALTYAAAASRNTPATSSTTSSTTAESTPQTLPTPVAAPAFDYHAKLQRITTEIETKLKAKLEAAIANLQASVDALEQKFETKLNQQIASLKSSQADKTTQETHSRELEGLARSVGFLVNQVSRIADKLNIPTPLAGVGRP